MPCVLWSPSCQSAWQVGPSLYVLYCHIQIEVHNIIWEEDVIWAQGYEGKQGVSIKGLKYAVSMERWKGSLVLSGEARIMINKRQLTKRVKTLT